MIYILKVIHYFWLIIQKLQKNVFKNYHLDPMKFLSAPGLAWQAALKINEVKLELLTDIVCY